LRPHDAARFVLDGNIVQGFQSTVGINRVMEVDVSISERSASHSITTDTNGGNRSNLVEQLKQMPLRGIRSKVSDVERSRLERRMGHDQEKKNRRVKVNLPFGLGFFFVFRGEGFLIFF